MITLKAQENYNPRFAPSGAKKAYIARITGRDSKMTFAREFIGHTSVDVDTPGLYECRSVDKKGRPDDAEYTLVYECLDGNLGEDYCDKEDAMKIAKAMESRSFDAIIEATPSGGWRFQSIKQAEQAVIAQTIDSATEACWQVLAALPEREAKKVMAALKARVSPKLPPSAATPVPETPVGIVNDYAQDHGAAGVSVGMDATPIMQ